MLITLVIIGVIAAITVPTLINKTQNQETVSKLKKAYSTLAQATNLIIAEEGTPKASVGGWFLDPENAFKLYKSKLIGMKECGIESGCFAEGYYKRLNGGNSNWDINSRDTIYKLRLTDGTSIGFNFSIGNEDAQTCTRTSWGSENICAGIYVDVNGNKKPNKIGRDMFVFVIKENGLFPAGCDIISECSSTSSHYGYGCTCKILREGAMNY